MKQLHTFVLEAKNVPSSAVDPLTGSCLASIDHLVVLSFWLFGSQRQSSNLVAERSEPEPFN